LVIALKQPSKRRYRARRQILELAKHPGLFAVQARRIKTAAGNATVRVSCHRRINSLVRNVLRINHVWRIERDRILSNAKRFYCLTDRARRPMHKSTPRKAQHGASTMRKKTLWQIREFGQWPDVYSRQLGDKLRSNAQCDKIVKRITRNKTREFYVAPVIIRCA
jgi:hypothetical protein